MTFDLTKEELRRAAVQVVGHVLLLHGNWRAYRKLFRGNADSVPIIRAVASELFWLLERDIKAAVFISFRKLTDGPKSVGKTNASFHGLLRSAAGEDYAMKHPDLVAVIDGIRAVPAIKEHVNKYMAHFDLSLLSGKSEPPESVSIEQVEEALAGTRSFMDEFMARFLGEAPFDYEGEAAIIPKQVERLVAVLSAGLETESRAV